MKRLLLIALSLFSITTFAGDVTFIGPTNGSVSGGGGGDGTGDVVGPASSTDNAITRFNGSTGKAIQNSSLILDDSGNITKSGAALSISTTGSGALTLNPVGDVDVTTQLDVASDSASSGVPFSFRVTDPAHTGLTAGNVPSVVFDLSSTKQITAGLAPLQILSAVNILGPTYGFTSAQDTYVSSTVHINRGPLDGTNGTSFLSAGLLVGAIDGVTNADSYGDITIIPNGISNGIGDITSRSGLSVTGGPGVSLGNQTAALDVWSSVDIASIPFYSTTNTRTIAEASSLKIGGAPSSTSNVAITNAYALKINSGLSHFGGPLEQAYNVSSASESQLGMSGYLTADADGLSAITARLDANQGMTSGNTSYVFQGHLEGHASDTDHNYKIYSASSQKNGGTSTATAFDAVGSSFNYALHATSGDIEFAGYDAVIGSAIESLAGRNLTIHAGTPIGGNTDGGDLRLQTTAKAGAGAIGNIVIYGGSSAAHFSASQTTAPTSNVTGTVLNDGGGSGASTSIVAGSTDTNGKVNITAGTGGAPGVGKAAAVVFNQPFKVAPKVVIITPAVPAATGAAAYVATISATGFEIWFNAGVSSGAATTFYYLVIG